jgi:hypothetical protein
MAQKKENPSVAGKNSKPVSMSRPAINFLIITAALLLFLRVSVRQGWVNWPPSNLSAILSALAGWVAIVGPLVLFRHEEQTGAMGLGDRVWITTGIVIWLRFLQGVATGRIPGFDSITSLVKPSDMAIITLACLIGGMISRPKRVYWTWTNLVGWGLGLCWLATVLIPSDPGLLGLLTAMVR